MKKLLALVLVTVMVLSSVATSLAVTADSVPTHSNPALEDYNGENGSDYVIDFWVSDATIAEGATTAKVSLNVKNNIGFGIATTYLIYPACLSAKLPNSGLNINSGDPWDESKTLYSTADVTKNLNVATPFSTFINASNNTGFTYNGKTAVELVESGEYLFTAIGLFCEQEYASEEDMDEDIVTYNMNFKPVDCAIATVTFTYDESKNPTGKTELPILLLINNWDSAINVGENGEDSLIYTPATYNGCITVPAQEIAPCEHTSTHEDIVSQPTCTEAGLKNIICDECGEVVESVEIAALGHTEEVIPAVEATCTTAGSTEGTKCSVCGEIIVAPEEIPAMGDAHVPGEAVIVEATCTEEGSRTVTCTVCGEVIESEVIAAKGHVAGKAVIITTPTTETAGAIATKCSVCGAYYDEKVLPAVDAYTVSIDNKIVTAGSEVTVAIKLDNPSTGSNSFIASPYWSSELNATVVAGDEIFEGQTFDYAEGTAHVVEKNTAWGIEKDYAGLTTGVLAVLPEDITVTSAVDGTVAYISFTAPAEAGEYKVGVVLNDDYFTVVPGTSAMYGYEVAERIVEATVTVVEPVVVSIDDVVATTGEETSVAVKLNVPANGLSSFIASPYWSSDLDAEVVAGDVLFAEQTLQFNEGTAHVVEKNAVYGIEKDYAGLTTGVVIVEGADGTTESGNILKINFTPTVPGEYVVGIVLNDDYATVIGEKDIYAYDVADRIIEAKVTVNCGHLTTEVIPAVDATCTTAGSTEGLKCSVCGEIITAPEEIPALGHTEEIIPGVPATCTTAGSTEGVKCSVCGEILVASEEIPALGHTEEVIPAVDATCTTAGSTEGVKCAVCGEILVAPEEISALGHSFGEWVTVKEATRDEEGLAQRTCERCGEVEEKVIEKLPPLVFPLRIEPGYYAKAAECSIDNDARVITLVSKDGASEVDFRFLNSASAYTYVENDDNIKTKLPDGTFLEDGAEDIPTSVRYFMAYAKNGLAQTYTVSVTKDGETLDYTVIVTFTHTTHKDKWVTVKEATREEEGLEQRICSVCGEVLEERAIEKLPALKFNLKIEPGYFANASECSIDNDSRVINIVTKANAREVDFRFLNSTSAYTFVVTDERIKTKFSNGTFLEDGVVAKPTAVRYFVAYAKNGLAQTYTVSVTKDGETLDYTVNVTFVR